MYTEIIKIIEGGLAGDKEKVRNYSQVLIKNLNEDGEVKLARKIENIILNKKSSFTSLDGFSTKPVDTESRMDIVEITMPQIKREEIILNKFVENEINIFIDFYNKRDDLLKQGLELPNSLLLYGPPGCGKTTVAQYISTVTGLPLVTARLDGLVSSLLGSTAKNIRKIFDYASKRQCILFLDEFDVIAKLRDDKNELGELKRVVNSLIQNIDSLNNNSILIAATNHHDLLDPAIWRRFSKIIALEKPQKDDVKNLLIILLRKYEQNIINNSKKLDQLTNVFLGCSHSVIETIINNTIRNSIIKNSKDITIADILKEVYFYKYHNIDNEDDYLKYLIENGATHQEIHENLNMPLRKIQQVSKLEKEE